MAFICGTIEERTRARTYLKWLLKQRAGSVYVDDLHERDDVTIVPVPREAIGYVTGNRGSSLRQVICVVVVELLAVAAELPPDLLDERRRDRVAAVGAHTEAV